MKPRTSAKKSIRSIGRRSVSSNRRDWVKTERLFPESPIPVVLRPSRAGLDLVEWARAEREHLEALLLEHRALLFRGFGIEQAERFAALVGATSSGEMLEYRDRTTPRSTKAEGIYTSTVHPADQRIHLHNEGTYWKRWPRKLYFACFEPSPVGGATPIADVRNVYERIPPTVRARFEDEGMMLVRNYNLGFGLPWQEVYQTDDRAEVERYCAENDVSIEWLNGDRLRARQVRPAVRRHPITGENVWFNHAAFFHVTSLEPDVRDSLLADLGEENLPYNTYYGSGARIEDDVAAMLREAYAAERILFSWQRGDVMLLDNMSVAHAREPYEGHRDVVVAMTEPVADSALGGADV